MMSTSAIKHHCVYSLVLLGVIFGYLLGRISKNTPTAHMSNLPNWVSDGPSALSREFKTGTSHTFPMQQFGKFHGIEIRKTDSVSIASSLHTIKRTPLAN